MILLQKCFAFWCKCMKTKRIATVYAVLVAALYAINIPLSKILLKEVQPTMMAAFLYLGAAKTSAYYSIAPFLGVVFGMVMLGERPAAQFYIGLIIMIAATVLMVKDTIELQHTHEHAHIHTHEHSHGELVHTHEHEHLHSHIHTHGESEDAHGHTHDKIDGHDHTH